MSQTENADGGRFQKRKADYFTIKQSQDTTPIGQCCVSPIPQLTLFPRSLCVGCEKTYTIVTPPHFSCDTTIKNMKIRGEEKWPRCHECSRRRGNSGEWFCSCLCPKREFQKHIRKVVFALHIFMGGGFKWSRFFTVKKVTNTPIPSRDVMHLPCTLLGRE